MGTEPPQQVRRLFDELGRGDLEIGIRPVGIEPVLHRLANRLVLGVLTADFIVSLAALLAVYHSPGLAQWAKIVVAFGFVVASVLGVYLAWSIFRSDRS